MIDERLVFCRPCAAREILSLATYSRIGYDGFRLGVCEYHFDLVKHSVPLLADTLSVLPQAEEVRQRYAATFKERVERYGKD